ncbi:MAG: tetratricopeptide repeat protein, partial [Actinomycetota bacterium]
PELCEAVGIQDVTEAVRELLGRGFLVRLESDAGDWIVLHSLVRDFAIDHWPLTDDQIRELHLRAARWFEARGDLDSAIQSLHAAADQPSIARIIQQRGDEMLRSGHADHLISATDLLAGDLMTPELEQLAGEARQIRGDWTEALACYRRAADNEEVLPPGLAWRMGLLHYLRAEIDESLKIYARGRVDGTAPRDEALLLAWSASSHWAKGDADGCRAEVTRAREAAEFSGDPQALAAVYTVLAMLASALEGDRRAGDRHYRLALDSAERAGDVLQMIRIRTNRGSHLDDEGRYEEALGELEAATGLAELTGFTYFLGLGLSNRASVRFHLGQVDEAIADNKKAVAVYRDLGSLDVGHPLRNLGDVYRVRGDLTLSRACYEEAIELSEISGDRQVLTPALAGLARVLAGDDPEAASKLARRAVSLGPGFDHLGSLLTAGWVALARDDGEEAARITESAAATARETRDRPRLAELLELQVFSASDPHAKRTRLDEALSIRREIHDGLGVAADELALGRLQAGPEARALAARAERRLAGLGIRMQAPAAGVLACIPRSDAAPVQIRSLGGFAVLRNGRPVPAAEWQSKKARDLLKLLVARRGRPTPRDLLAETLWPDEDPAKLANRLSVALSIVRTALDPDRLFPPERFIVSDQDAVALDLSSVAVDVEAFLADADAGLDLERQGRTAEAHDLLVAAEATYAGDFLEEDLYEDWSIPLREEARAAFISVSSALARAAVAAGDHEAGIPHFLRLLERDPYVEGANLGLVSALTSCGRHGEARHHYRAYVSRMTEIEVEAAPFPAPAFS